MRIGPYQLKNNLVVAPMAGVTDRPFRQLCKQLGAGMAVSEMVASQFAACGAPKNRAAARITKAKSSPISVQIAGADPAMMAEAARYNVDHGAQIIDINMGCPAKKVCNVAAGSALLQDEPLVARIVDAVVRAVDVPVTLKIRTGWDREQPQRACASRGSPKSAGIQRSRCTAARARAAIPGDAEYDTIARGQSRGQRFR